MSSHYMKKEGKAKHVADMVSSKSSPQLKGFESDMKKGFKSLEKVSCSDMHGEKYAKQGMEEKYEDED